MYAINCVYFNLASIGFFFIDVVSARFFLITMFTIKDILYDM